MLQKILEKPLEKKAGRNYGPPGSKTMIYFIDDMNMPQVSDGNNDIIFIFIKHLIVWRIMHYLPSWVIMEPV